MLDLDSTGPDWVIDFPPSLALFQELGIDYNCGGKSLRTACLERQLNPQAVLRQLQALMHQE